MMKNDNNFDLYDNIHDYLEGNLEGKALADFEVLLKKDKSVAEEVQLIRNLSLTFGQEQEKEEEQIKNLRATLEEIRIEWPDIKDMDDEESDIEPKAGQGGGGLISIVEKGKSISDGVEIKKRETALKTRGKVRRLPLVRIFALAASVAILIIATWFLFFNTPTTSQLYAQYAQHETLSLGIKSDGGTVIASQLETAFNQEKYAAALPLAETYLKDSLDFEVLLAKAIAEIELEKFDAALSTLDEISQSDVRVDKTDWYRALIFLKKGEVEKTKEQLKKIIEEKRFNYSEAEKLLRELE